MKILLTTCKREEKILGSNFVWQKNSWSQLLQKIFLEPKFYQIVEELKILPKISSKKNSGAKIFTKNSGVKIFPKNPEKEKEKKKNSKALYFLNKILS